MAGKGEEIRVCMAGERGKRFGMIELILAVWSFRGESYYMRPMIFLGSRKLKLERELLFAPTFGVPLEKYNSKICAKHIKIFG